ncbi:hypothetical protein UPYG_G00140740 [Umbra pygmaea]|uniref:Uncharacterized protein n=1 Tax=Umbra pygmaea TaxID=75934 RepID=A0ABD0XDM1_UMBPY
MFLWKHPGTSLRLKKLTQVRGIQISGKPGDDFIEMLETALGEKGTLDSRTMELLFDVIIPEVIIKILKVHQGMCRYMAEVFIESREMI